MVKTVANTPKVTYAGTLVAVSALLAASLAPAQESLEESASGSYTCRLNVEGKFIEKLVLLDDKGNFKEIYRPEASLSLPAGQYKVLRVHLLGGYYYETFWESVSPPRLTLTPDRPCKVKVGGPLTPSVRATRLGKLLKVDYHLHGVGGRQYQSHTNRPRLTVFKGDSEIGSAAFGEGPTPASLCSSWQVPLTAGSSRLKLVVSHELGDLGASQCPPVFFHWR